MDSVLIDLVRPNLKMATLNLGLRFNRRGLVGGRKLWVTFGGRRGVEVQDVPASGPGHYFDLQAELHIAFWVGNISADSEPYSLGDIKLTIQI